MPDRGPPETPGETAETSDDDHEITVEPVPHRSSSHWEWRPEYEVPPPEPGDPGDATTSCCKEIRQKRLRSEPVRIVPTDRRGTV